MPRAADIARPDGELFPHSQFRCHRSVSRDIEFAVFDWLLHLSSGGSCASRPPLGAIGQRVRNVIPDFPRCAALVQLLQLLLVLESVHALPEAGALMCQQGPILNQPLKRLAHEFFTWVDVAKDLITEYKETAVDPDV